MQIVRLANVVNKVHTLTMQLVTERLVSVKPSLKHSILLILLKLSEQLNLHASAPRDCSASRNTPFLRYLIVYKQNPKRLERLQFSITKKPKC